MARDDSPREYSERAVLITGGQRAALITGGARGIGAGMARLLAGRGYRVAIADLGAPRWRAPGIEFFRCDVSREAQVRACVRRVLARFGRLDALVNNAGIADP